MLVAESRLPGDARRIDGLGDRSLGTAPLRHPSRIARASAIAAFAR
jgi:hypothetical protein